MESRAQCSDHAGKRVSLHPVVALRSPELRSSHDGNEIGMKARAHDAPARSFRCPALESPTAVRRKLVAAAAAGLRALGQVLVRASTGSTGLWLPKLMASSVPGRRSFPITAAGQLRNRPHDRTGFPLRSTPRGKHRLHPQHIVGGWGMSIRLLGGVEGRGPLRGSCPLSRTLPVQVLRIGPTRKPHACKPRR
jgi:hypothetical protein